MDFVNWKTILVVFVKRQLQQRIGWVRFRKNGELLLGNKFTLKIKGKVYR